MKRITRRTLLAGAAVVVAAPSVADNTRSIRFYTRALAHQSGGGLTETHAKLGETLVAVGRKAEGIPHLRRAARDTSSPWGERARNKLKQIGAMPQGPLGTRP